MSGTAYTIGVLLRISCLHNNGYLTKGDGRLTIFYQFQLFPITNILQNAEILVLLQILVTTILKRADIYIYISEHPWNVPTVLCSMHCKPTSLHEVYLQRLIPLHGVYLQSSTVSTLKLYCSVNTSLLSWDEL